MSVVLILSIIKIKLLSMLTNKKKTDNTYFKMTFQSDLLLRFISFFNDSSPVLFSRKKKSEEF